MCHGNIVISCFQHRTSTTCFRTCSSSIALAPPVFVHAVLLDDYIYEDWMRIRVAIKVLDQDYNSKTNQSRVHITAITSGSSRTANCQPHAITGTCVATISAPSVWISDSTNVMVYYGLSSSIDLQQPLGTCAPIPRETAVYENNLMVNLPSRPLRRNDEVDLIIEARAATDVESTKFTLFLEEPSSLEVVGAPIGLNGGVWAYQFVVRADGFTAVLNRKPDAVTVTTHPQETQQMVQVRLRIKSGAVIGRVGVQLRVQELNAPTPVNPGGQTIPEGGYVLGCALDSYFSLNSVGHVVIVDDDALDVFAVPYDGLGTIVHSAPLTGLATEVLIDGWSVHRYGTTLRRSSITGCSLASGSIFGATLSTYGGRCRVLLSENVTEGNAELQVTVVAANIVTTVSLRLWAPELPLVLQVDTPVIRPIDMSFGGVRLQHASSSGCHDVYMISRVRALTRFAVHAGMVGPMVDVTHLVAPRMTANTTGVVALHTGVRASVTGVASGVAQLSFGNDALGSIVVTVDPTEAVHISSLEISSFASMTINLESIMLDASGVQTAEVVFNQENMTREGIEGQQQLVSTLTLVDPENGNTYTYDALADGLNFNISFVSENTNVVQILGDNRLDARGTGTTRVRGILTQSGSCGAADVLFSNYARVSVTLPSALSVHLVDETDTEITTILVAHDANSANLAGTAPKEQQIRVMVVYPTYTRDLTEDSRTVFESTPRNLFSVGPCSTGRGTCLLPNASISGDGQLNVTFAHESVVATVFVTVVRGVSLRIVPQPYPAYDQSSSVALSNLALIGSTGVYQQAALSVELLLSNGRTASVYRGHGLTYSIVNNTAESLLIHQSSFVDSIVWPSVAGVTSVQVQLADLSSTVATLTALATSVSVTHLDDLQVPATVDSTVYSARNAPSTVRLQFGARFSDGSYISRIPMFSVFNATFRSSLVTFESADDGVLRIDSSLGTIVSVANYPATVALTVRSTENASVASSIEMYSNLASTGIDVDFATDSSRISRFNSLQEIAVGGIVRVKVYVSSGVAQVGSLTMEMDFDPSLLAFSSVVKGGDDGVWVDTVIGEVRSDDPSVVRFGGITTNYARGNNWHFATVTFTSTGNPGTAVFSGRIVEIADSTASNLLPMNMPINAGDGTALVIGTNELQRRSRKALLRPTSRLHLRTRRDTPRCVMSVGPYPLGDVNRDCQFSGVDALLTAQYTLVNDDQVASASFVLANNVSVDAMDADANNRTDTRDTSVMLYILFGGLRFVQPPQLTMSAGCAMQISVAVEQSSSDATFASDPSRSTKTEIVILFTGDSGLISRLATLNATIVPLGGGVTSVGRSAAYAIATPDLATGVYSFEMDGLLDVPFGVSVIQIINTIDGWVVPISSQYMSVGNPYPLSGQTENNQRNLQIDFQVHETTVSFFYSAPFAPMQLFHVDRNDPACATPTTLSPTAEPTIAPSVSPTPAPTILPTSAPTLAPTPLPSVSPTALPTSTPTPSPTVSPSESPSAVPTYMPTASPSLSPTAFMYELISGCCRTADGGMGTLLVPLFTIDSATHDDVAAECRRVCDITPGCVGAEINFDVCEIHGALIAFGAAGTTCDCYRRIAPVPTGPTAQPTSFPTPRPTLSPTSTSPTASPTPTSPWIDVIRINCGGPSVSDALGRRWVADTLFSPGGETVTPSKYTPINLVPSDTTHIYGVVLATERYTHFNTGNLRYVIHPPAAGTYLLQFVFVEVWHPVVGTRIFDVDVQGSTVFSNLDVLAEAGWQTPILKEVMLDANDADVTSGIEVVLRPDVNAPEGPAVYGISLLRLRSTGAPTGVVVTTAAPTRVPTFMPSHLPTVLPTLVPSQAPSATPTNAPTVYPTTMPTSSPTSMPTAAPLASPTTLPTALPTVSSLSPPTSAPTNLPSAAPTFTIFTSSPSFSLSTASPSVAPTSTPSARPTAVPTALHATVSSPSATPTTSPTRSPSAISTRAPSTAPTIPTCPLYGPDSSMCPDIVSRLGCVNTVRALCPAHCHACTSSPSAAPTRSPTASVKATIVGVIFDGDIFALSSRETMELRISAVSDLLDRFDNVTIDDVSSVTLTSGSILLEVTFTPGAVSVEEANDVVNEANHGNPIVVTVGSTTYSSALAFVGSLTATPTLAPTVAPTTTFPTLSPTALPTEAPSTAPSSSPTTTPSSSPTFSPSTSPTVVPTNTPTPLPTAVPSAVPTAVPTTPQTASPTTSPSDVPTASPTATPATMPTIIPTAEASTSPTVAPTVSPTTAPTGEPSKAPTAHFTNTPTTTPTATPTTAPSQSPTASPTVSPTFSPTAVPSTAPTTSPTSAPTVAPFFSPTAVPSTTPSASPTIITTTMPTVAPSAAPSETPTASPTASPTVSSMAVPSNEPTTSPTTFATAISTSTPSVAPSESPTMVPTEPPTFSPTVAPFASFTAAPSVLPPTAPTLAPSTLVPTAIPSWPPTVSSTTGPTSTPSAEPTTPSPHAPTTMPSSSPSETSAHTPTANPTGLHDAEPTSLPTFGPITVPTELPTPLPSGAPTTAPSPQPSTSPSMAPSSIVQTSVPTTTHTMPPTTTVAPAMQPTMLPTSDPSSAHSDTPTTTLATAPTGFPTMSTLTSAAPTITRTTSAPETTTTKTKDDNETSSSGQTKNGDSLITFIESESMLYILVGLAVAVVLCSFVAYTCTRRKRAQWESASGKSGSRSDEESVVTRLDIARGPTQPPLTTAWQRQLSHSADYMQDIDLDDDDMWWERATERAESRHGDPSHPMAREEPPKQLLKRLTNLNLSPDLASPDPLADCGEWDMISEGHVSTRMIPTLNTRRMWSPGEDVSALSNC